MATLPARFLVKPISEMEIGEKGKILTYALAVDLRGYVYVDILCLVGKSREAVWAGHHLNGYACVDILKRRDGYVLGVLPNGSFFQCQDLQRPNGIADYGHRKFVPVVEVRT